ncbi:biotin--[acetyl-CoA-carboxylase] ligase [Ciceribacter sp. L1K22]|uniref:biotin--[acetyl-CoA-carboxylase] ligase n=1 Tax=Ciceribacter sp. L1K22 TaxID=2820275 RepID=UPI001ABE0508|nr:biotin--[acetyl-CoA-carboxylase] ligase [Ciceribacter sp. L1K22]MBO3759839.1 biotin--[acetyl-CoA-carboxylase] ligase [Ciceribacter sp. L1K22]
MVADRALSLGDFRHEALGEVSSTNAECLERARQGDPGNLWLTATAQTGGRGRRGRTWHSAPGNLYASLLLIDPAPMEALGSLPLAVALAVYGAVRRVVPPGSDLVEIKWPNDILIGRRKTCGILIEGERLTDGRQAVVVGIGVNIAFKPDLSNYPVTCLREHGASASPEEVFAGLFSSMVDALSLWKKGVGVAAVVSRWRYAACGMGERITVNLTDRAISGLFSGIDDKGLLLLTQDDGRRMTIAAGDVFFEQTGLEKE